LIRRQLLIIVFLLLLGTHSAIIVSAQEPKKIPSIEAYDMLNTLPDTYLIDVRTRAEYQFVGHPVRAFLFPYLFLTDQFGKNNDDTFSYQFSTPNKNFIEQINTVFKKEDNLLIICRDGERSQLAAQDLINAGFKKVFDVFDGFEGPEFPTFNDSDKHKFFRQLAKRHKVYGFKHRRHYGWQWWGLPWTYEMDPKYIYPPDIKQEKENK